jgi:hypothetical protein
MKKGDYGQKAKSNMNSETDMYLPGSPDARSMMYRGGDMYDNMEMTGYGKKVSTKKNTTGTGEPNTGIQGSQDRGNKAQTQDKSQKAMMGSKSYQKHYGGAAGKCSSGMMKGDEYDYGKGRMKKGDTRKHTKAQGK